MLNAQGQGGGLLSFFDSRRFGGGVVKYIYYTEGGSSYCFSEDEFGQIHSVSARR